MKQRYMCPRCGQPGKVQDSWDVPKGAYNVGISLRCFNLHSWVVHIRTAFQTLLN